MATLAERVAAIGDPMPALTLEDDFLPGREEPTPQRLYHIPVRPAEEVWREGFQLLYATLRDVPEIVSVWAYWVKIDAENGGYWNLMVVADIKGADGEEDKSLPSDAESAMAVWQESGPAGMLLDWFVRTPEQLRDKDMTALKGRPVYLRRDSRMPAWINALKTEAEEQASKGKPPTAQATPWWV